MLRKKFLKLMSLFLCTAVLISNTSFSMAENSINDGQSSNEVLTTTNNSNNFSLYTDINNHWSKSTFERAYNDGIIKGFEDNTIRPDAKITQAQMLSIITRILNTSEKAGNSVLNIADNLWYKEAVEKSIALGIIDTSNISSIDKNMTRKDAFTMISKAFQLTMADPDMTKASSYTDFNSLNLNEKINMASLVNCEFINGWDGSLQLKSEMSRAEFVTLLYRIFGQYFNTDTSQNYGLIEMASVLTGKNFILDNITLNHNIWLDASVSSININNSIMNKLFIRSDNINSLNITNSKINRLLLASRGGNTSLNCSGIETTIIGDGIGEANLNPAGNTIEVTGSGRTVNLDGQSKAVLISGDYNTVSLSSLAYSNDVKIYGKGNNIIIDSNINNLLVKGEGNNISGTGTANNSAISAKSSTINIKVNSKTDTTKIDDKMTATINAPTSLIIGNYLNATLVLKDIAEDKNAKITWYKDGKETQSENIQLNKDSKPSFTYYIDYELNGPESCTLSCKIEYTTNSGINKIITAPNVTVKLQKTTSVLYKISSVYNGNNTTKWAKDHNLSNEDKAAFVNTMGYSSSSKYLIWVNIGTQYASVFEGSQGNWKLVRSGLVSTGLNDSTPKGEFKTTYKQSNWTTDVYTVKPVVRFYEKGYALHSVLYYSGTTKEKPNSNGLGYPLSDGCVRMQAQDIQWIYDNVPNGTTIVIY